MKLQKGLFAPLGLTKELLNIPISISILHEKEYHNIVRHNNEKRRSLSEKNKSNVIVSVPIRSYRTEIV
jgi:hypothetical protein